MNVDSSADRYPQWSFQETKEFLVIRDNLDQVFLEMKRNKLLWEVVSVKMREKGYNRNAEQCKCKWKNLVTRYKAIFGARMQRMLWVEEERGASCSSRKKPTIAALFLEDEKEEEDKDSEDERGRTKKKKKKKAKSGGGCGSGGSWEVRKLLEDFMNQQSESEVQCREAFEAREIERRAKEMEWQQTMEALENDRIVMDQMWREREEQRRAR